MSQGFNVPGGESTSAALRRVEQERDRLAAAVDDLHAKWEKALSDGDELTVRWMTVRSERNTARADLESMTRERFEAGERAIHLAAELATARTAYLVVSGQLATARTELDAQRTARDNLDRQLGEARASIRAFAAPNQPEGTTPA